MQVTLNQKEIETAIITFVGNQGISTVGKRTEVTLIAGRGPSGMTASIEISDGEPQANVVTPRKLTHAPTVIEISEPEPETDTVDEPEEVTAQRPLFGN